MRRRMFAWLGFFLTSSAVASAQDIVPPPGFSPAPGGTAAPPAARIVGDPENLPPAGDFDDPYGRRSQLSYDPTTPYSPYSPPRRFPPILAQIPGSPPGFGFAQSSFTGGRKPARSPPRSSLWETPAIRFRARSVSRELPCFSEIKTSTFADGRGAGSRWAS